MSTAGVVQLWKYQSRRARRYEHALALYGADRDRVDMLRNLWSAIQAVGGDRAAVVWVDEYGQGLAHTHVVLDLLYDRPRRTFPVEPLCVAWCQGVPGLHDVPDREDGRPFEGGARSMCAVALGSDGLRVWFFVVDGQTPRPRLSRAAAATVMYSAGRCTSMVMHRDMKDARPALLVPEGGPERFAGWPVLKDIQGREDDALANRRISLRFIVSRIVRSILDDDLAIDEDGLRESVEAVRREIGRKLARDPERAAWDALLDAVEEEGRPRLAATVLDVGVQAEEIGHLSSAREFYRSAYEAAMATGDDARALDAARLAGRAWRKGSGWDEALGWYEVARSLAAVHGDKAKEAVVLDGMVNVHREKGNLPRARRLAQEVLEIALASGDRYAVGSAYHQLMTVSFSMARHADAVQWGWKAVQAHHEEQDRLNALTALAGVFVAVGELEAAESAYAVVARRVQSSHYRLYALSGYAHVAGLRGERREYERRLAVLDASGFAEGPAAFRAEAWLERGRAYEVIGLRGKARDCYREAVRVAGSNKVGQVLIQAEEALEALRAGASRAHRPPAAPAIREMAGIREELGRMREASPALAGV